LDLRTSSSKAAIFAVWVEDDEKLVRWMTQLEASTSQAFSAVTAWHLIEKSVRLCAIWVLTSCNLTTEGCVLE
jgi:hypothetical protein